MIKFLTWQQEAFDKHFESGTSAIFAEPGCGKTFVAIQIMKKKMEADNKIFKLVVFAPLITLSNWKDEFEKFWPEGPEVHVITGSPAKKKKLLDGVTQKKSHIVVINYEALTSRFIQTFFIMWKPEYMVLDESHRAKNPDAKRYTHLLSIATMIHKAGSNNVLLLTGTPILNTPLDVWAQYRLMDDGEAFGQNYYFFRSKYFIDKNAYLLTSTRNRHYPKWAVRKEHANFIQDRISDTSVRVKKDDVLDLPEFRRLRYPVPMTPLQLRAYKLAEFEAIAELKRGNVELKKEGVFSKLRQIVSGFLMVDGTTEHFKDNPKLLALTQILEMYPHEKVIVWCQFREEYKMLGTMMERLKIPHTFITGEQTSGEKFINMDKFNTGDTQVLIGNQAAGGIGVNLCSASISVVFSRNFSLNDDVQSEARNFRHGSEIHSKVIKYDIVVENSIDEVLLRALKGKANTANALIDHVLREE